jgi:Arc/MetJ-type ribon-helix-helix transcriptional regulator
VAHKVVVEVNQQQAQMLDRLVDEGTFGVDHAEVIRSGFLQFCEEHPELLSGTSEGEVSDE